MKTLIFLTLLTSGCGMVDPCQDTKNAVVEMIGEPTTISGNTWIYHLDSGVKLTYIFKVVGGNCYPVSHTEYPQVVLK